MIEDNDDVGMPRVQSQQIGSIVEVIKDYTFEVENTGNHMIGNEIIRGFSPNILDIKKYKDVMVYIQNLGQQNIEPDRIYFYLTDNPYNDDMENTEGIIDLTELENSVIEPIEDLNSPAQKEKAKFITLSDFEIFEKRYYTGIAIRVPLLNENDKIRAIWTGVTK
ncbi:MAG: hypothetical protein ACOCQD_05450, partial [archaeon]